tara:strand:+ start:27 stop:761 length:735 start_codon:yes stop_codon:yes gene_type:complete
MDLLCIQNAKTVKGQKKGYLTGILYLASSDESGYQVCPMAKTAGCEKPCLDFAGRGKFKRTRESRIRKTRLLFEDRALFLNLVRKDIKALIRKAERENLIPCVRLNGTSDLWWYEIIKEFPTLQFYDYSKMYSRSNHGLKNYHVTLSVGKNTTLPAISRMLHSGNNVAVVFRTKNSNDHIFISGKKWPQIDGDETDLRFLDGRGVVVALTAKGKARKDYSGFVKEVKTYHDNYSSFCTLRKVAV